MGVARWGPALLVFATSIGLACQRTLPPIGEVIVVVDTDLSVPKMAGRLRVDVFTASGTWYATRDLALPSQTDWPASFALALAEGQPAADVVLRLRAYPQGKVRDYLGERHQTRPVLCDTLACSKDKAPCCPLLVPPPPMAATRLKLFDANQVEITPTSEPLPALAVDRLVRVHLEPDVVKKTLVVLRAACTGTMADLGDFSNLATCVDTENQTIAVTPASLDPDLKVPATLAGTFEQKYAVGCTAVPRSGGMSGDVPLHDEEACVVGGAFVLGGSDASEGLPNDPLPERAAYLKSFLMDRFEVTIARYRKVLADGYVPMLPLQTAAPGCLWTTTPSGHEEQPLNCIRVEDTRDFCMHEGGDLPTEAQWEYAATAAGRRFKTHYPWGDGDGSPPSCDDVIYGRAAGFDCPKKPSSPAIVTAVDHAGGDVTTDDGGHLVDLGGNVAEHTADAFAFYASNCWLAAPLAEPSCQAIGDSVTTKGSGFADTVNGLLSTNRTRTPRDSYNGIIGFRCVRPGSR